MGKPVIELSECISCGICHDLCPEVFRLNQSGFVEVIELAAYPGPAVDEVVQYCPADCIGWEEG